MKLSIWHCEALYVIAQLPLPELPALSGISFAAIKGSAMCDKWDAKKAKYTALDAVHMYDVYTVNLIITEFTSDPRKVEFINGILDKIKKKESMNSLTIAKKDSLSESRRKQYIAQLGEFGMDEKSAMSLVASIERDSNANSSDDTRLAPQDYDCDSIKISIQDELDTVNAGYKYLADAHDTNSSQIHADLRKKIKFFSAMIEDIETKMPQSISFDELIQIQRNIRHAASAYASLVQLHYDTGGLKGYVNHHAAVAKLFGQGYMVIKRDEMGRLIDSSLNSNNKQ
jgi:hypothetical protein